MKRTLKRWLRSAGYDVQRLSEPPAGSSHRPIGKYLSFLEDVRARGLAPKLILDVGANKGEWTRMAKRIFPEARFLLVEPQSEMRSDLNALCKEFANVSWIEAGAGKVEGVLKQMVYLDDPGASSFLVQTPSDPRQSAAVREVRVVTVDALLQSAHLGPPELLKIDVQGFEIEVLKGAESLMGKTELIVLEASLFPFMVGMPLLRDVVTFMGEKGYEVYDIAGFFRRPLDGALGQLDLAFAKADGILRRSSQWR